MTTRCLLRLVTVLAVVSTALPAAAQRNRRPPPPAVGPTAPSPPADPPPAAPDPDANQEARQLFEAGVSQMEALDFSAAVTTFRRSLELRESPAALYNLGLAQRGAGSYRDAIATLVRFKAVASARHGALVASADAVMTELRAALGRVRLTVRGGATEVRVDDTVQPGQDGTRELELDPGHHRFVASREGYDPVERTLELDRGQTLEVSLDASERPRPGRLSVETGLPSAEIRVNGERRALGEYSTETPAGHYRVEVRASGYLPQSREVDLRPGGIVRVAVTMARRTAATPLTHRWWFWTAIGVAATATVGTIIYLNPVEGEYEDGTLGFTVEALERR